MIRRRVEGNRGSAKTRSILTILILRALRWPKSRWALWRSSRSRLTETVLETLETQVLPLFAMSVPHVQNRTRYTLPNGSMLIPIGLDDIYRGTSAQFAGGYLNEGIEIGTLAEVESLISTLRQNSRPLQSAHHRYQSGRAGALAEREGRAHPTFAAKAPRQS